MAANPGVPASLVPPPGPDPSRERRLERGDVIYYPVCPFALPEGADRDFLLAQRLSGRVHKNISYDPHADRVAGFRKQSAAQEEQLRRILAAFSRSASGWLADALPRYSRSWRLDRTSFRPEEEAVRSLRLTARNDLLHVDAFPSRPTNGHLILRCFVNLNPTDPRVWATSEPFGRLLERYGPQAGLPAGRRLGWTARMRQHVVRLFHPGRPKRSVYDAFMLHFHNYLKANADFQERTPKRYWSFAPGSAWVVFSDITSHAVLRGRYALEHSYFVAPEALADPAAAPWALLERACGVRVLRKAA